MAMTPATEQPLEDTTKPELGPIVQAVVQAATTLLGRLPQLTPADIALALLGGYVLFSEKQGFSYTQISDALAGYAAVLRKRSQEN